MKPDKKKNYPRLHLAPDIIWTHLDRGEKLLIDIPKKRYYVFDRISWDILGQLSRGTDKQAIAGKMAKKYRLPPAGPANIYKTVNYLLKQKLLLLDPPSQG